VRAGDFLTGRMSGKFNMAAAVLAGAFGETIWLRHEMSSEEDNAKIRREWQCRFYWEEA
jgi:hypothetical protein